MKLVVSLWNIETEVFINENTCMLLVTHDASDAYLSRMKICCTIWWIRSCTSEKCMHTCFILYKYYCMLSVHVLFVAYICMLINCISCKCVFTRKKQLKTCHDKKEYYYFDEFCVDFCVTISFVCVTDEPHLCYRFIVVFSRNCVSLYFLMQLCC